MVALSRSHLMVGADYIDKNTLEIKQDEEKIVYKDLQELADELPDNSPRYILLSYPLTLVRNSLHSLQGCLVRIYN